MEKYFLQTKSELNNKKIEVDTFSDITIVDTVIVPIVIGVIGSVLANIIIAITAYSFRYKLRFFIRKIIYDFLFFGIEGFYKEQKEFEAELDKLIKTSKKIKVLTCRGSGGCEFIHRNRNFLTEKNIEIILADPYSQEGKHWIEYRDREVKSSGYYDSNLERGSGQDYVFKTKMSIQELIDLNCFFKKNPEKNSQLKIYLYRKKPIWCFYIFDSVIYIGGFTESDFGRLGNFYKITKRSVLYKTSERHFDYIKESFCLNFNEKLINRIGD